MRVLVTRPEPGASATSARLLEAGFQPLVLPLTETVPVTPVLPGSADFDAVAVTSASAVRHAPARLLESVVSLPCFAVGEATANAARAAGFGQVEAGAGGAEGLAGLIRESLPAGGRVLYLCGRLRTGALAHRLADAGLSVTVGEVYDTIALSHSPAEIDVALGGESVDAALIYSAFGAAIFSRFAMRKNMAHLFDRSRILCISDRAAGALDPAFISRAEVAAARDDDAMFALLSQVT